MKFFYYYSFFNYSQNWTIFRIFCSIVVARRNEFTKTWLFLKYFVAESRLAGVENHFRDVSFF